MNASLLLSGVAVTVAAGALALQLQSPDTTRQEATTGLAPEAPLLDPRRLDALEEENRILRDRLSMLEVSAPAATRQPVGGYISREEFEAFVEELAAGKGPGSPVVPLAAQVPGELKEQVATTLETLRREEAAEKAEAQRERYVARLDKAMPALQTRLGLTQSQSERLRAELEQQQTRGAELYRRWQEGEDDGALGQLKQSNHEDHQAALQDILDTAQLEGLRPAMREAGLGRGGK